MLKLALAKAGIDPDQAYYVNAMRCLPTESPPGKAGIEACRERLAEEVLAYPRRLILVLGNSAARSLLGDHSFKITSKRGIPIDLDELGIVLPTFHPASILRNQGESPRWFEDIRYAAQLLEGGSKSLKRPPKPTAHVMLLEPNEAAYYPKQEEWRSWDPSIKDGSQLADWPVRKVYSGIPAAVRAVDYLLQMGLLSADIETGYSYSPRIGKVLCLGVSWSETEGVVFSEGLLEAKAFRPHLIRLLTAPNVRWAGHNWKYDSGYLRNQFMSGQWPEDGAFVPSSKSASGGGFDDSMLIHYSLDETKGTHALEDLSRDLLGAEDYKYVVRKYAKGDLGYENVPREVLYPYCLLDTSHTRSIYDILEPKLRNSPSLSKLYDQLLLPASAFLQRVQDYGLWVDQVFVNRLDELLGSKVKQAEKDLLRTVAPIWNTDEYMASSWATKKRPEGYNARNWRHTSFMLEKLIGWVPMNTNERTLRDLDQTGKDQSATFGYKAKNYARGHPNRKQKLNYPYIQALIDYRLASHAYGMLVKGTKKNMEPDGRLHTTFNLQATETGRLSSTGPNLQNLPVPEKDDPIPSRNIVGAPPGRVIIEGDYSQVELRLLAHFSKDKNLVQVYLDGRDLHTELSIAIWGDRVFDRDGKQIGGYTNYQRVRAKAVNFGIAYGRGAGSIAAEHDIPEEEAEEMRKAWFAQFPQAHAWLLQLQAKVLTGQTVVSPFGRRRRFGVVSRDNIHELKNQATNFPMQSTGTDLTLLSGMRLQEKWDREGVDAHIVCLVHDALVAECPEDLAEQVASDMRAVMADTPKRILQPVIDFPVDVHIGRSWGTLKVEEMDVAKKSTGNKTTTFGKAGVASGKL